MKESTAVDDHNENRCLNLLFESVDWSCTETRRKIRRSIKKVKICRRIARDGQASEVVSNLDITSPKIFAQIYIKTSVQLAVCNRNADGQLSVIKSGFAVSNSFRTDMEK